MPPEQQHPGKTPSPHLAWLVLVFSLAVTGLVWHQLRAAVERNAEQDFRYREAQIEHALQERLRDYRLALQGGLGLLAASEHVSREEWRQYLDILKPQVNFPGMLGMGYALHLPAAQRASHIRKVRAEGFPDYTVWPEPEPDAGGFFSPIYYLEPLSEINQRTLGHDMARDGVRRAALERARDSGLPSISAKLALALEENGESQTGFLMVVPHYAPGKPLNNPTQRHDALLGWVFAPLRMDALMRGILGPENEGRIDIEIFDGAAASEETELYDSDHSKRLFKPAPHTPFAHAEKTLDFAGRAWTLHLHSLPAFEARIDWQKPRLVLLAGLSISLLLFALTRNLIFTRISAEKLAAEMTRALAESESRHRQMFETNQAVKLVIDPSNGQIIDANPAAASYYGYSLAQLRAMRIFDINPMPPEALSAEMAKATKEHRLYFNFKHRLADGQLRDVEVYTGPVVDKGKSLLYSVIHDVTSRNQALAEQRAILDNAVVGIIHLQNRTFLWANQRAEQMLGRSSEDLRGQSTQVIYDRPEDFERVGREGYPALARGEHYQTECPLRRADGSTFWADLSGKMVEPNDVEGVSIWIIQDVSEKRAAQDALAARTGDLELSNRNLRLLSRMTHLLQGSDSLDEAYSILADFLPQVLPGSRGVLFALDENGTHWPAQARWGDISHEPQIDQHCWALRSRQVQFIAANPDQPQCPLATEQPALCLPLQARDQQLGVLHILCAQGLETGDMAMHQHMAERISERLALSLSNLHLRHQLKQQSLRDPLTGLYNRRHLSEVLEREVQLALRKERSLAVVLLDIDHFKRFNDQYGHAAGDKVLRAVAREMAGQVRETDTACRYGGEEFLLLLPEASKETALSRAESLRTRMRELALHHAGKPLQAITISLGVAVLPEHGVTSEAIVAAADTALYQAKAEGRNRSVVYPGHRPS